MPTQNKYPDFVPQEVIDEFEEALEEYGQRLEEAYIKAAQGDSGKSHDPLDDTVGAREARDAASRRA